MQKSKQEIRDEAATDIARTMKRMVSGMRLLLEAELEGEGLSLAQLRMLSELHETPGISSAELARSCFITPQSMQTLVARAEREGWIVRSPSSTNRRILTACLTAKGRKVLERGKSSWSILARDLWDNTSIAEMRNVNAMLTKAIDRLQPKLDVLHPRSAATEHAPPATG